MTIRDETVVTEDNLDEIRGVLARVAPEQADALVAGCRTWTFENPEGFGGRITVWPDDRRGALAASAKNHWGVWDPQRRKLRLDNGDVYSDEGAVGEDA